jgi:hypothetical protein
MLTTESGLEDWSQLALDKEATHTSNVSDSDRLLEEERLGRLLDHFFAHLLMKPPLTLLLVLLL